MVLVVKLAAYSAALGLILLTVTLIAPDLGASAAAGFCVALLVPELCVTVGRARRKAKAKASGRLHGRP